MKLRVPFPLQQLLFGCACALILSAEALAQGGVQATFKMKNSAAEQQGTVLGASAAGVQIQIGAQTITLPPSMFETFKMAPPPEYGQGYQAFVAGDNAAALAKIKSVTDRFKGLPTDWAQYAMGLLGDIYVSLGKFGEAETAYSDYKRLYQTAGANSPTSEVGLARIAVAKKDYTGAKARLEPITTEALKNFTAPQAKALAYSRAFLVSGQVKEAEGNPQGALEDYLRTVTLYYQDPAAVSVAQERADALRAASKAARLTVP